MKKKKLMVATIALFFSATIWSVTLDPKLLLDSIFTIKNKSSRPVMFAYEQRGGNTNYLVIKKGKKHTVAAYLGKLHVGKKSHNLSEPLVSFPGAVIVEIQDHSSGKIKMRGWWGFLPGKWKYPWGK